MKIAAAAAVVFLALPLTTQAQSQHQVANICGTVSELTGPVMNMRRKGQSYERVHMDMYRAAQGDSLKQVIGQTALDIVWDMTQTELYEKSRREVQSDTFARCMNDLSE